MQEIDLEEEYLLEELVDLEIDAVVIEESPKKQHYVNNEEFFNALMKRTQEIKDTGRPSRKTNDFVGKCIVDIANRLSYSPNFRDYTFRTEMQLDGIENCYRYIDRFNPEKTRNPFAYFTQIIFYAFVRRIKLEKKQMVLKARLLYSVAEQVYDIQEQDEDLQFVNGYVEFLQDQKVYEHILQADEKKRKEKKLIIKELADKKHKDLNLLGE